MEIKFGGQEHQIDANTLINVLVHYQTIINEANKELSGGSHSITLTVNAIRKGSFVIDLSIVQTVVEQLFSKDTLEYLIDLGTVVGGVIRAYKKYKGRPAKSEEERNSIKVTDGMTKEAVTINNATINVYNQPIIREAMSKAIQTSQEDPYVDSLSIKSDEDQATTFNRKEFGSYIYDDFDNEDLVPEEITDEKDAILTIISMSFESGNRWMFMYNGFKIGIRVKDDALKKKIDEGERFGKGDAIKVRLRIIKRYNQEYKTYENKSFKILEFYKHIIPQKGKEGELFT